MVSKSIPRNVHQLVRFCEQKVLARYPWLRQQDQVGFAIFAASILMMAFFAYGYAVNWFPAWLTIISIGVATSILHEIEHDLIHKLYFKHNPWVHNFMMFTVWLLRGNTVNPWFRREIHLLHHRESGQLNDIEERLVGLGLPWGLKRFLITVDPFMALLQFRALAREARGFSRLRTFLAGNPTIPLFDALWYTFLANAGWRWFHGAGFLPAQAATILNFAVVVYIAPNVLRSFSLNFVTTACHYYGDIEANRLVQQTQVLNRWYLLPMQIFCFNFGSTHVIHHFVVTQPFYLRQMVAPAAHRILRKYGVRFNDMGATFRQNRFVG